MSIKVTCSNCLSNFNLNDSLEGKKVRCSKCKSPIDVIKKDEPEIEEVKDNKEEIISSEFNLEDTLSLNDGLIDNPSDNDDFLEKSMDIGEEPKKAKLINKKLIIVFIIMLLLGAGIGYAYKTGLLNNYVALNSAKETKKEVSHKEISDINYMLDFSGSFESINSGKSKSGSLNISGLKVYSNNKGLNQRISLGGVSIKVGKEELFSGSNLDIVSDNEKVYLFLEKGFNQIVKTLGQNYSTGTIDLLKSSFGTGKYVKINNSKPLLTAFGELSKNKLLKDVIIGLSTSNPKEYFSKNGIDTKLQEYFKSDKVLKYLFKEGEKDINSGKIPLTLNSSICSDYAPVVLSILDQVKGNPLLNLSNNSSNLNLIEECNKSLTQANAFLPMFIQMYKEGDTTLGNFKLSISSGNMLDINITYKNHILTTAYLSMQTPDKYIDFKAKLDNTGKISSTLKLNYNKDGIIFTGSVIDGSGMIDIIGKQQGVFDISGKITIKDYFLDTYDIKGNSGFMGMESTLTASGNLSKGAIYFLSKAGEKEIAKLDFSYNGNSYNLDLVSDSLSIKSDYKNLVFNLDIKRKDYYSGEQSYNLSYNKGKIDGKISMNNKSVIIKGNYNNLKDFNINIFKENDKENNNFILKTQIIGLSEIKYIASLKSDGKNIFEANVNVKKSKDKGYEIYDINGYMTDIYGNQMLKSRDTTRIEDLNNKNTKKDGIYFNSKLKIKTGGVKYSIPKNYNEVDVKMNERFILPDYTSAGRTKIDRKTLLIGGTTGLAIGGTVAYISLQGYSADAKNSKRTQDLNNIAGAINIKSTMGAPLQSFIVRNEKYEGKDMYVGGVKLVGGVNYFAGTPNYIALGVKPEDFKDPNGEEYKIGVTTLKGGVFEILGYIENGDGIKTAKLNGTYNANDTLIIKAGKDYEIIGDNVIKIIPTYINRIQRNDIIGGNKVLKISPDGSEITFQQKFDKKIIFLIPDTKGLISVDGSVIKDGDIK